MLIPTTKTEAYGLSSGGKQLSNKHLTHISNNAVINKWAL